MPARAPPAAVAFAAFAAGLAAAFVVFAAVFVTDFFSAGRPADLAFDFAAGSAGFAPPFAAPAFAGDFFGFATVRAVAAGRFAPCLAAPVAFVDLAIWSFPGAPGRRRAPNVRRGRLGRGRIVSPECVAAARPRARPAAPRCRPPVRRAARGRSVT
ncbi:MAG: hypothetical protein KatS3mg009_2520 [Acidimicrobiia bacterium]|nr:MAG: hypothetical protein KatS3mg009_2520 [Acidimicrobiia bacterium]